MDRARARYQPSQQGGFQDGKQDLNAPTQAPQHGYYQHGAPHGPPSVNGRGEYSLGSPANSQNGVQDDARGASDPRLYPANGLHQAEEIEDSSALAFCSLPMCCGGRGDSKRRGRDAGPSPRLTQAQQPVVTTATLGELPRESQADIPPPVEWRYVNRLVKNRQAAESVKHEPAAPRTSGKEPKRHLW